MIVYRMTRCRFVEDLKGTGSQIFGGRWNSNGVRVLYAASSPSLALLECLVHLNGFSAEDFCMAHIRIPAGHTTRIHAQDLPEDWASYPAPDLLKSIGDRFIRDGRFLGLSVPSAVMPEESIWLLNPTQSLFGNVKIELIKPVQIDSRLL